MALSKCLINSIITIIITCVIHEPFFFLFSLGVLIASVWSLIARILALPSQSPTSSRPQLIVGIWVELIFRLLFLMKLLMTLKPIPPSNLHLSAFSTAPFRPNPSTIVTWAESCKNRREVQRSLSIRMQRRSTRRTLLWRGRMVSCRLPCSFCFLRRVYNEQVNLNTLINLWLTQPLFHASFTTQRTSLGLSQD